MATQWPLIVNQLLTILPTLPGWSGVTVHDGIPVTATTTNDYVLVGFIPGQDNAGSYSSTQDDDGFQRDESGEIVGRLTSQTGTSGQAAATRTRVFALMDAFDAYIRANRTLGGVLSAEGTVDLTVAPLPLSNADGTAVALDFSLTYTTVT